MQKQIEFKMINNMKKIKINIIYIIKMYIKNQINSKLLLIT